MLKRLIHFNETKITNYLWVYVFSIFFINVIFKIIYLDFSSYWYDEIISIKSACEDFGHIKHVSEWDKNPPFYYYCLKVWVNIFNDSEFYTRLLSVIFSSLAASLLFLFSNRFFNKTTAIIASVFYLSSNLIYFYSHEARVYSLVVLLSLISSFAFFNLKEKPDYKNIFVLGLVNFLLIYSHYIAGLVLFFQCILILFYFDKKQRASFLYSMLIVLVLVCLRFTKKQFMLIISFNTSEYTFWLPKSSMEYLNQLLSELFFYKYLIIPMLILIASAVFFMRKLSIKKMNFSLAYCVLVGFGSIIVLFFLGKITPIFLDRYLIFVIPFVYILISFSISLFKYRFLSISVCILFFIFSSFKIDYKTDKGMDYKNAVAFIKLIKTSNDLIIVKTKDVEPLFCYYYDKKYLRLKKKELNDEKNIIFCNSWNDVNITLNNFKRVIVIDSFEDLNPHEKDFVTKLSEVKTSYFLLTMYKGIRVTFYK